MTAWTWTDAVCTAVVDGDTIDLELTMDVGFGARTVHRVRGRLNRVNALPLKTPEGRAAAGYVARQIRGGANPPLLTVVTVAPYKFGGPHWSPGEWMVEVTLANGKNLSDLLVQRGHAVYWDGQGPRPDVPVKATLANDPVLMKDRFVDVIELVEVFRLRATASAVHRGDIAAVWIEAADDLNATLRGTSVPS